MPRVWENTINGNHYQLGIDKHMRTKYKSLWTVNTIVGDDDVPVTQCLIF